MDETEEGVNHTPSGRLLWSAEAWARWYRSQDQELLRRELLWALGWLKSPIGLAFLFIQLLAPLLFWIGFSKSQTVNIHIGGGSGPFPLRLFCMVLQLLLTYGAWVYLYQLRVRVPLQTGRLHDLLLSDLEAKSLWPGLFMAPVAVMVCFKIFLIGLFPLTGANIFLIDSIVLPRPSSDAPLSYALFILFHLVHGLFFALAISAFVSYFVGPKGGVIRIVLFLIIGMLVFVAPFGLFRGVIYILFSFIPASDEFIWIYALAIQFFRLAIEILIFRTCMQWLHGKRFWPEFSK